MDGLFVFDLQNDIIFTKLNDKVQKKLIELAKKHELLPTDAVNSSFLFIRFLIQKQTFYTLNGFVFCFSLKTMELIKM